MEGGSVYGGCHDMIALLENSNNSLWLPSSSTYHETMVNFDREQQPGLMPNPKSDRFDGTFGQTSDGGDDVGGEESDANLCHNSDKKRRLTPEQVQFLEQNFELENKLEPQRKLQIAQQVGLKPRQVAIWFQNRRARYKTKQIEREYDSLKANYDRLKVDYDSLYKENENLKNEVEILTKQLAQKEGKEIDSNPANKVAPNEGMREMQTRGKVTKMPEWVPVPVQRTKQAEEASSAKSDVFDSESPHCADVNHSAAVVEASSTLMQHTDHQSEIAQDENLMMSKSLLLPQTPPTFNNFLKVADDDPNANSCNFAPADDPPIWHWYS